MEEAGVTSTVVTWGIANLLTFYEKITFYRYKLRL